MRRAVYNRGVDISLDALAATLNGYFSLGHEVIETPYARFVRSGSSPRVYDANHAQVVRASTATEVEAVLDAADGLFADAAHRTFKVDPLTPPVLAARLLLDGYSDEVEIQLLLPAGAPVRSGPAPPSIAIRPVDDDAAWEVVLRLTRIDHEEEAAKAQREPFEQAVTDQIVATKRAKEAGGLRFFLASVDGTDCAFFSSWPGVGGVGKVEDLFTLPLFRRRGVGAALVVRCVADARERGAGPVLIGALPDDTPKLMYHRMGFQPVCTYRTYTLGG
jgi:GNAT superfamily N-acetyltransferase